MPKTTAPKQISKAFSAVLTRTGDKLKWVHIRLPFDAAKVWGTRGVLRVKGEINGFAFRTSIFPTGDGHHTMIVNKKMQQGGRATSGTKADFRLEPDIEKRVTPVPPELERALKVYKPLLKYFQSLAASFRNYVAGSVGEAKQAETRVRRAEQTAEFLMEAMEAEIELPPIIRQAFARNPEAAEGWRRMSPSHRRQHLLGIFYGRTFDARMRRLERAMVEMVEYAAKGRER